MKTRIIFKYVLTPGVNKIKMPYYLRARVGLDPSGDMAVWVVHPDIEAKKDEEIFYAIGTGQPLPEKALNWLGSVTVGPFVWHIWTPRPVRVGFTP